MKAARFMAAPLLASLENDDNVPNSLAMSKFSYHFLNGAAYWFVLSSQYWSLRSYAACSVSSCVAWFSLFKSFRRLAVTTLSGVELVPGGDEFLLLGGASGEAADGAASDVGMEVACAAEDCGADEPIAGMASFGVAS